MKTRQPDVLIVGATPQGAALCYLLARYTNLKHIALIDADDSERRDRWVHAGLQYGYVDPRAGLEQARDRYRAASMVVNLSRHLGRAGTLLHRTPKMWVATGADAIEALHDRYDAFRPHFPELEWWDKHDVAELEPALVLSSEGRWRAEPLAALGTTQLPTAVNLTGLVDTLLDQARRTYDKRVDIWSGVRATEVEPAGWVPRVTTTEGVIEPRYLALACGPSGLSLARSLGVGLDWSPVPVRRLGYPAKRRIHGRVHSVVASGDEALAVTLEPDVLREDRMMMSAEPLETGAGSSLAWLSGGSSGLIDRVRSLIPTFEAADRVPGRPRVLSSSRLVHKPSGQAGDDDLMLTGEAVSAYLGSTRNATTCLARAREDLQRIQAHLGCHVDRQRLDAHLDVDPSRLTVGPVV